MKMKKMLAVLSALTISASACLSVVPASAATEAWRDAYAETLKQFINSAEYNELATYDLYDVDKNGIPELFINPSPDGEYTDVPICYSTQMYSYGENGVTAYWGGEGFDWNELAFQPMVSETSNIICFLRPEGDQSGWIYAFRQFDAATNTWTDLGLYSQEENAQGITSQVLKDNVVTVLTESEYEEQVHALYDTMTPLKNDTRVTDTSYLNSFVAEAPVEDPTAPVTPAPLDYDTIYYNYVYDTLLPKMNRAALDITFNTNADVASVTGVVSSAIYDFGQDGVKELVVVTREEENPYNHKVDGLVYTGFYLNVYRANEKGEVVLLDKVMTPEYYFSSIHGVDGDGLEEVELFISGDSIYLTQSTTSYGSSGPSVLMHEYAVYDFIGDQFSKYEVAVNIPSIYDINGLAPHSASEGTVLYTDADLNEEWYDYIEDGKYTNASELESILTENFHANVKITKTRRQNQYQDFEYLTLNIQVEPAVKLMHYTGYVGEMTPYQTIEAVMVGKPIPPTPETPPDDTVVNLDYYDIYYNFVYNILIPDVGRAARTISSFNSDYDIDKLFGVVSTTIYDFDADGIDELLVITREEVYDENGYSRTYYNNTNDWGAYTTFRMSLYQADAAGNVNLLDSIDTEEHTVSSYPDSWYEDVQMVISGDCVYEEYVTHKYASSGSEVLCHEYVFYDVSGGQFSKTYKIVTDGCSVWEGSLGGDLLYYDDDLRTSYNMTFNKNRIYSEPVSLSNSITQYLADNFPINFTYAEVAKSSEKIADFINAPEYLYLNIDVEPAITLMHYQFSVDEDVTYQTMGGTMLSNPLRTNDDDDNTNSVATVSGTSSLARSSSPSSSSSNSGSSTSSPNTSDKLPVAAGLTGLAALIAGLFARRKNNG